MLTYMRDLISSAWSAYLRNMDFWSRLAYGSALPTDKEDTPND